jgi:hypothetical protein
LPDNAAAKPNFSAMETRFAAKKGVAIGYARLPSTPQSRRVAHLRAQGQNLFPL